MGRLGGTSKWSIFTVWVSPTKSFFDPPWNRKIITNNHLTFYGVRFEMFHFILQTLVVIVDKQPSVARRRPRPARIEVTKSVGKNVADYVTSFPTWKKKKRTTRTSTGNWKWAKLEYGRALRRSQETHKKQSDTKLIFLRERKKRDSRHRRSLQTLTNAASIRPRHMKIQASRQWRPSRGWRKTKRHNFGPQKDVLQNLNYNITRGSGIR